MLHLFVRAMGVTEPSSRIDVALGDEAQALGRVVRAVEDAGVVISSIVTLTSPVTGLREAAIRMPTIYPGPAIRALEAQLRDASHSATAVAVEPVTLLVIPAHRLESMVRSHPQLAIALIRQLARMAADAGRDEV